VVLVPRCLPQQLWTEYRVQSSGAARDIVGPKIRLDIAGRCVAVIPVPTVVGIVHSDTWANDGIPGAYVCAANAGDHGADGVDGAEPRLTAPNL